MQSTINDLRQRLRKQRAALSDTQASTAASALCARLIALDVYKNSQHIAAYWSVQGEIGLDSVIRHAHENGKHIYLPILDAVDLRFAPYTADTPLRINRFKLPEPDVADAAMRPARELDLVLAPLVVFDPHCNRVGMGGGYYDRTFEFRRTSAATTPVLVGVAHELQRVDSLPPEPWDVRLDAVVTEQHIYPA